VSRSKRTAGDDELGRFSEPALLILGCLAAGASHGYAIMKEVERVHGTRLGAGTLYGAMGRLEQLEYIVHTGESERRQLFRITPAGRRILGNGVTQLRDLLQAVKTLSTR
jgi:DNA-binding PadR family transcriptional regulator